MWRPPRDANLPKFKVDLGKGTVTIVDEEEERKKYARMRAMNAAAADAAKAAGGDAGPARRQSGWSGSVRCHGGGDQSCGRDGSVQ